MQPDITRGEGSREDSREDPREHPRQNPRFSKHHGPHPGGLALIYFGLLAASLILFSVLSNGAAYPRPFGNPAEIRQTYLQFPLAVRWSALFMIGSAIPLGLLTAALTSRLHFLGVNVTGVSIALFGGLAASIILLFSGLCTWVLSQPGIVTGDLSAMHTLQLLAFGSGGMLFTTALGLFMAGISVPCLFGGYAPRWLAWLGLILAGLGELSVLGFVFPSLYFLLPLVRFPSIVWMIGVGFTMIKQPPRV
jgi:hypothetical protein